MRRVADAIDRRVEIQVSDVQHPQELPAMSLGEPSWRQHPAAP